MKAKFSIWKFAMFLLLFIGACTMLLPFLWMLSTSLKESNLVYVIPPEWIPDPVDWKNYVDVWEAGNLLTGIKNSIYIVFVVVFLNTVTSSMSAFAFAKLRFPAKNIIFVLLLSSMMVPGVVLLVPQFIIYSKLRWIDTLLPMMVPFSLCNVNNIFFMRQYLVSLPSGYLEAARIDGCSYFGAYLYIFLPLCKPAIITNAIMLFMSSWNEYMLPLLFTNSREKQTIQVAIAMMNSHYEQQTDIPLVMAASCIALIPVVVLFVFCQKYFTESISMSGIKG